MRYGFRGSKSRYFEPGVRSKGWPAAIAGLLVGMTAFCAQAQQTDIAVTLSDSPDPVNAGDLLDFTISLTNTSGTAASDVAVTMYAPANTVQVFTNILSGTGWSSAIIQNAGVFGTQFTKATVGAGETASFLIRVSVLSTVLAGATINGTVIATTTTSDSNPANNTGTATTTVSQDADLAVSLSGGPDPVNAGANITYAFSLSNFGPSGAQSVSVTLPTPPGTTFLSASVTSGSGWSVSAPSPGGTGNVVFSKATVAYQEAPIFQVVVSTLLYATGTITATATATATTPDSNPGNDADSEPTAVNSAALPVFRVPVFAWKPAGR
ncbi:MAG: hypothetical protein IT364_11820 [Candidatus Hydrogenedentes bacterium]|nr:hypothetical protein [Candidatus Hydrogenedentota bacterium]